MTQPQEQSTNQNREPFLSIQDDLGSVPIYFQEDWDQGIGGGLWSTGLAFSQYLTTRHAAENLRAMTLCQPISVLELGSGNGLLSVCLLALAKHLQTTATTDILQDLVITDLADHLPLIQKTLDANPQLTSAAQHIHVLEHKWGSFPAMTTSSSNSFSEQVQSGAHSFDFILGSDVAYHPDLYDILIQSLQQYSHATTTILIGVTMNDTKPIFFHKLRQAGFRYQKLADHLLDPDFRGRTFGIFRIQKV
jgi:predicted nicotinamide N-methyase